MKKLNILLLLEDFNIGGLERVVETLYDGFEKKKYKIQLWCIASGGDLADKFAHAKKNVRILHLRTYHNPLNIFKLSYLIKKERFHIVHTHGYFAGVMGRIAAYIAGVPVIVSHVHTAWNLKSRNRLIDKLLSRITDKIICCSKAVRDFVVYKEGIDLQKTALIYNGCPCVIPDREIISNHNLIHEIQIIVVASLVENKGHRFLFEAIARINRNLENKPIKLIVVGDGPLKMELIQLIQYLEIVENVEFIGIIEDVQPIIARSDILVLPSIKREGMPIVVLEAMCHAKPVIGTRIGGIPELIEDGVNGFLIEPKDSTDLSERILMLVNHKLIREQMGMAGRQIFLNKYTSEKMIQNIDRLYDSLLRKKAV